jgi:histidine ammonia-lyase
MFLIYKELFSATFINLNLLGLKVQDPYTLRCIPQVHGIVVDTINFTKGIITTEMNSATDNPMVLKDRNMVKFC